MAAGGKIAYPVITSNERGPKDSDFNDLARLEGIDQVVIQLAQAVDADDAQEPITAGTELETDFANAERFINRHCEVVRFSTERGWLAFDATRWRPNSDPDVQELAKDTVRSIYGELAHLAGPARDHRFQWAKRSESAARVASMIKMAHSDRRIRVHIDQLDADPMLLNVRNGTIDLRTGELKDHRREDLITRLANVDFDPNAKCDLWRSFLDRVFSSDKDVIGFVRRFAGYAVTGDTREQVLILAYGAGANGKTVFIEVLRELLADYGASIGIESLATRKRMAGAASADLARLVGRRLVTVSEIPESLRLNEALVKDLTGGDTISARSLYENPFDFRPQFKLLLRANHRPEISGTDEGIWRRVRLLPFTVTIPPQERDHDLGRKLLAERAGILNWAIRGCLQWQQHGLGCPAAVQAATEQYRVEQDLIGAFLEEHVRFVRGKNTYAADLYRGYRSHAEQAGEEPLSQKAFGAALTLRGVRRQKKRYGVIYIGLDLK